MPVPSKSTPTIAPINPPMRALFDGVEETADVGVIVGGIRISKISTVFETAMLLFRPPTKNILFTDEVEASQ
jgi:hypothetical protein